MKAKPPTPITVAQLDAKRVYWGVQSIPADQLTEEHVQVPADCDLKPGLYMHSKELERFEPLQQAITHPSRISEAQVLCELARFAQMHGANSELLAGYITQFENSVDPKSDIDGASL